MGKRSEFERISKDKYRTPAGPIDILAPYLSGVKRFVEPCAGDYCLADRLEEEHGLECVYACDIEPDHDEVCPRDALDINFKQFHPDAIITNPPWDRKLLHPMIMHFSDQCPTWLLFDADWAHTVQSAPFMSRCTHIISIGRVQWIPGSGMVGKDNCAWYRFEAGHVDGPKFIGRKPKAA